jgi:hypothetical protein
VVWFDFFLTAPYEHFTITRRADIETTVLLLVVGAGVTELAVRGRRYRVRAELEARYLAAIGSVSAASAESPPAVTRDAAAKLTELLGLRASHFEHSSFGGMPRLEPDGRVRAGDTYLDVEMNGWPSSSVELLVQANGRAAGRFVLEPWPGAAASAEARRVASILAGQVAAAISDAAPARR